MNELKDRSNLRPYYDPETFNVGYTAVFHPNQGVIDEYGHTIASKLDIATQSKMLRPRNLDCGLNGGKSISEMTTGLKAKFFEGIVSQRNGTPTKSLRTLEWSEMFNLHVWRQVFEKLMKLLVSRYFKHLIQQPFEVARLLLQVGDFKCVVGKENNTALTISGTINATNEDEDSMADDETNFFVTQSSQVDDDIQEDVDFPSSVNKDNNKTLIKPESIHTIDILNSIMDKEGMRGVWRANNTQFIYNFLSVSLDAWFTGLLSPILQIPDPYFIDIIHSSDVKKSASLMLLASCLTGLVLLPMDLIRTRFIICTVHNEDKRGNERSLRKLLKKWTWRENVSKITKDLLFLNLLDSLIGCSFSKLTPAILYHQFNIDRFTNTILYTTVEFCTKVCELFVKLPIENLLRRCQVKFLLDQEPLRISPEFLIIKPNEYKSIYHTLFHQYNRIDELWRGWRLGLLSIVCGYGVKILNKQSEPFEEEKF